MKKYFEQSFNTLKLLEDREPALKFFRWKLQVENRVLSKILSAGDILAAQLTSSIHDITRLEGSAQTKPFVYLTIHGKYLGSESAQLCTSLNTERLETLHDQVLKTLRDIPILNTPSHDYIFVSLRQLMTIQHEVVKLC